MVRGAIEYLKYGGLQVPEKVYRWTESQRTNWDDLAQFLDEWCVCEPGHERIEDYKTSISATDLHEAFCLWYARYKDRRFSISAKKFAEMLNKKEIPGPCPLCGGEPGKSDRFVIWPDREHDLGHTCAVNHIPGVCYCRQCRFTGDSIKYLMEIEGLSFGRRAPSLASPMPLFGSVIGPLRVSRVPSPARLPRKRGNSPRRSGWLMRRNCKPKRSRRSGTIPKRSSGLLPVASRKRPSA